MKIRLLFALVATVVTASAALPEGMQIITDRAIVVNGPADATSFSSHPSSLALASAGSNTVNSLSFSYQFYFADSEGTPVNVQDFRFTSTNYSLFKNAEESAVVSAGHGSYNPEGGSKPDLLLFNAAGTKVSPETTPASPLNTTVIASASRFQILDQQVPLGSGNLTKLTAVGQSYEMKRTLSFEFRIGSQVYQHTIGPADTSAKITVVDATGVPEATEGGTAPYFVKLYVSENLANWFVAPDALVPAPLPGSNQVAQIIALAPASVSIPGISNNSKRFYRFMLDSTPSPST